MVSVIPWTVGMMEAPSYKLLWVSEVASSATTTKLPSVKVTDADRAAGGYMEAGGQLGVPGGKAGNRNGAITPMEEFEPFEDAVMDQTEYEQLKVIKLLKKYNGLNMVRVVGPLAAGVLGLWAALVDQ